MEVFFQFFGNIFNVVIGALFCVIGILFGLLFKPKAKNHVTKLIPRDHRFIDFNIIKETAVSLICEIKKGFPPQRFFKLRSGWTGQVGRFLKRTVTKYFGIEGTAYTWKIESGEDIPLGTLSDSLKVVWGEPFYNQVPAKQRELVEESKIGVTVDISSEPLTPKGFRKISEEDIKSEQDRDASETFWKGKKQSTKIRILEYFFIAMTGFAICAVLFLIGILKVNPPPAEAVKETVEGAAGIIQSVFRP